jgi:hypothetical protein
MLFRDHFFFFENKPLVGGRSDPRQIWSCLDHKLVRNHETVRIDLKIDRARLEKAKTRIERNWPIIRPDIERVWVKYEFDQSPG